MKSRLFLVLLAAVGVAAVAACTASTDEEDEDVETEDAELKGLALKCKSGPVSFDVTPGKTTTSEGSLDTGAFETSFVCAPPKAVDAGPDAKGAAKAAPVLVCSERPQKVHDGSWSVAIDKSGKAYKATVKRGKLADLTLACTTTSVADAGTDAAKADAAFDAGKPGATTYADVAPLLANACGPCHGQTFGTLDQVKKRRRQMLDALNQGRMPRNNPSWRLSDDGKKVIGYLQNSPDFVP